MFQVSADCHRGQIERCTLYSSYNSTYPHVRKHPRRLVRDISPFSSPVLVSLVFRVSSFNSFFAPIFFPVLFLQGQSQSRIIYFNELFFSLKKKENHCILPAYNIHNITVCYQLYLKWFNKIKEKKYFE